jgi:beta-N-acetylhexosaminidase
MILHCNGKLDEMHDVAGAVPPLAGEAARRADRALAARRKPEPFDVAAAREEFAAIGVSA